MKSSRMTDQLFSLLKDMATQKPISVEAALPGIDDLLQSNPGFDMTVPEVDATKNNLNLLKVVYHLAGSKSVIADEIDACLTQIEGWLGSKTQRVALNDSETSPILLDTAIFLKSETPYAPSWRFFHESYLIIESLSAVSQMAIVATKKGSKSAKLPKERVERITSSARRVHDSIQENARKLKSKPGMLGSLVDLVFAGTAGDKEGQKLRDSLEKTLDVSALEISRGELIESWEEGLDGMLAVTL